MQSEMMKRASELLADGTVVRVLGWKNGEFVYDPTPAVFDSAEALEKDFVYHDFCGSNLSKYLIKLSKLEGKTLVFLKPCDSIGTMSTSSAFRVMGSWIRIPFVLLAQKVFWAFPLMVIR